MSLQIFPGLCSVHYIGEHEEMSYCGLQDGCLRFLRQRNLIGWIPFFSFFNSGSYILVYNMSLWFEFIDLSFFPGCFKSIQIADNLEERNKLPQLIEIHFTYECSGNAKVPLRISWILNSSWWDCRKRRGKTL